MSDEEILGDRLREAGYAVKEIQGALGGAVAVAGLVTLEDGSELFAKTLIGPDRDVFLVESTGLSELRSVGGANTPDILCASPRLLVLEKMRPRRGDDEDFWGQLAQMVAALHLSTVSDRFGWHRDG